METQPQIQTHSNPSSPEFEFWMVRNPSSTPPHLLTADQLFADGFLLPLHLLSLHPPPDPPPPHSILTPPPDSGSKRWIDIFKSKPDDKKLRSGSRSGSTDLNFNLNIWPFSRSHSAGNTSARIRSNVTRKVSSAPCSRSNSRGESSFGGCAGRRWTSSPGRPGVHLGRSSPVRKVRRTGMGMKEMATTGNLGAAGGGVRLINLNVNSCIGYQNQVTCRDDDSDGGTGGSGRAGAGSGGSGFSFRALFSKKVVY